jgi:hypothetical protein
MRKAFLVLALLLFYIFAAECFGGTSAPGGKGFEPGRVVVKLLPEYRHLLTDQPTAGFGLPEADRTLEQLGTVKVSRRFRFDPKRLKEGVPDLSLILLVEYSKDISPYAASELLMRHGCFEYAEPLFIQQLMDTPNDPYYAQSSYLSVLNAAAAWDIHKGSNDIAGIVIAIVDTGVRWWHPDLRDNLRINTAEMTGVNINWSNGTITGGNGIDDDGNGYVDDVIGWDFMLDSGGNEGNNPSDGNGHGTIVAGIANARTNNGIGVSALPWNLLLLPISASFPGSSNLYKAYDALLYACENGADVINFSAGSTEFSQAEQDVIEYIWSQGTIIVAAAGNMSNQTLLYPASYPKVVSVTAVQNSGVKSVYASYGPAIDVCAPTGDMYTTTFNGSYNATPLTAYTSYATPVATALAALIRSAHPDWSNQEVVNQLIATCNDVDAANPTLPNLLGEGMLDAYGALSLVNPQVTQELKLVLAEVLAPSDANGNLALEPDELFSLNLKVCNYAFGVSSSNVTYTLSCSDPFLIILNNTHNGSLPADGYDVLSGAFQCRVAANATTKAVTCTLTVSADVPVAVGSSFTFSVMLNAGGIFVWEGKQEAGYSGRTIRNLLQAQGHSVYYTTVFPYSLRSFSAVFLSFGMATALSNNVTRFDRLMMYNAVKEYLELGGKLYIEGNDAVGFDLGYYLADVGGGQSAADVLWPLLGIGNADDGSYNALNLLTGFGPACTEGISFTASSQTKLDFMDWYVPASSAAAAFHESDYGIVAVQNYGQYGQKSFIFSYCLAELADGTAPNTKATLISRIIQDFNSPVNTLELIVPDVVIEKTADSVSLSWLAVPHAVQYRIEASDEAEQGFIGIETTEQLFWEENGVMPKRFYRVIARSFGSD